MSSSEAPPPTVIETEPVGSVVVRGRIPVDELRDFFDTSFGRIGQACAQQGIVPTGAAFARYHGEPAEVVDLEVGLPTDSPVRAEGGVEPGSLPAGQVVTTTHHGGYDGLPAAWQRLVDWFASEGRKPTEELWEVYVTEPGPEVDPATLRTDLFWRIED